MPQGERRDFVFNAARQEFERRYGHFVERNMARYQRIVDAGDVEILRLSDDPQVKPRVHTRDALRAMHMMLQASEYLQDLWDKCFAHARLRMIATCGQDICEAGNALRKAWDEPEVAQESALVKSMREELKFRLPMPKIDASIAKQPAPEVPAPQPVADAAPPMPEPASVEPTTTTASATGPGKSAGPALSAKQLKQLYNACFRDKLKYKTWQPLKQRALREHMSAEQVTNMVADVLEEGWRAKRQEKVVA